LVAVDALRHAINGIPDNVHRQVPSPGPSTFNLKHQRPTQQGSHHNQPGEKAKAGEGKLDRYGFHYVSSDQNFEAEQQRSTNPYFVLIVMPLYLSSTCKKKSRPDDTGDYNEDAENFDADTHQMDQVTYGWFEGVFHPRSIRTVRPGSFRRSRFL
jgi:hypothetical protein